MLKFPHNSQWGGGEKHTESLIQQLQGEINFSILTSDQLMVDIAKRNGCEYKKIAAPLEPVSVAGIVKFPLDAPSFYHTLKKEIKKYKEDGHTAIFCLSYTEKILITSYARALGMSVFWMEHLRIGRSYLKNPFRHRYNNQSKKARVITVSNGVKQQLIDHGVDQKNISVIYNGINADHITPKQQSSKEITTFGTLSRLSSEKAIDNVIAAFLEIEKKYPNIRLKIAGTGPLESDLKKQAQSSSQIQFVGFINDVPAYLQDIDVFLLTSRDKESFGIAAAEAMAAEIPVIGTDITGLNELILHNKTGKIVPIDDTAQIASEMEWMIKNPLKRQEFGRAGRQRVMDHFRQKKMIAEFRNIFMNS